MSENKKINDDLIDISSLDEAAFFEWIDGIEEIEKNSETTIPDEFLNNILDKTIDIIRNSKVIYLPDIDFYKEDDIYNENKHPVFNRDTKDIKKTNYNTKDRRILRWKKRRWIEKVAIIIIGVIIVGCLTTVTYAAFSGRINGLFDLSQTDIFDITNDNIIETTKEYPALVVLDQEIKSSIVSAQSFESDLYSAVSDLELIRQDNGTYGYEGFIFDKYNIAIFTKENSNGWEMKKGQTIRVTFEIDPYYADANGNGEMIEFGFVKDGIYMYAASEKKNEFNFELTVDEDGTYYPTIQNMSVTYLKVYNLNISIE